jgi:hypothetical protein
VLLLELPADPLPACFEREVAFFRLAARDAPLFAFEPMRPASRRFRPASADALVSFTSIIRILPDASRTTKSIHWLTSLRTLGETPYFAANLATVGRCGNFPIRKRERGASARSDTVEGYHRGSVDGCAL